MTFAPLLNSLDHLSNEDEGEAQKRFRDIVMERYVISKHTNTTYCDSEKITPTERRMILGFIEEDLRKQNEMYEKAKAQSEK